MSMIVLREIRCIYSEFELLEFQTIVNSDSDGLIFELVVKTATMK